MTESLQIRGGGIIVNSIKKKKASGKNWITIWLVVSILIVAGISSFAVYAEVNNKMKRVIAPSNQKESQFTSNYLSSGLSNIKFVYFNEGSTNFSYDVVIRNYSPLDPGNIHDSPIEFTLSAELVHKNGTAYAESPSEMNDESITLTCNNNTDDIEDDITLVIDSEHLSHNVVQTISGVGDTGKKIWHVSYSNIPLGSDYCIKLTAAPTDHNLQAISATIVIDKYPAVHREGWSCSLVESGTISDYDAFNYTIIGTGSSNLIFSYDESKLTINPAFYTLNDIVDDPVDSEKGDDWKEIVIHVDSGSGNNRFDIQLYKVYPYQPASFAEVDPNAEGSYVEFTTAAYTTPTP